MKDTGHGISDENKKIVFERFGKIDMGHKRNYEGAGLGLSISKAYVEQLGGKIWVESELDTGSVFYFTIPYNFTKKDPQRDEKQESQLQKPMNPIKNLKILIAEDDEYSEMLLRETVKNFTRETISVKSGIEAVESCKNNPDLDLIFMDISLMEMNGFDAAMQIRNFNKNVVIIMQTASLSVGENQKAIDAGCNDFISKPFNREKLIRLMNKHLSAKV